MHACRGGGQLRVSDGSIPAKDIVKLSKKFPPAWNPRESSRQMDVACAHAPLLARLNGLLIRALHVHPSLPFEERSEEKSAENSSESCPKMSADLELSMDMNMARDRSSSNGSTGSCFENWDRSVQTHKKPDSTNLK